jgi:hypothetical protein
MKDGLRQIVGKTISSVVVAKNEKANPRHQVFLVFSDGTSFEFFGPDFSCASGLDRSGVEEAKDYAEQGGATIINTYSINA